MTRRRRDQSFTQRDATRALKAAQAAGDPNAHIEIDTIRKTITIIPGEPPKDSGKAGGDTVAANPWDEVLHERH
jgi:hypothetical protein